MADWKVSVEQIELQPHPNADRMQIAKVGNRQYVVQKGLYENGDWVVSVPEKSLLPEDLAEPFKDYLSKGNKVRSVKLRGELSEGVLLSKELLSKLDYLAIVQAMNNESGEKLLDWSTYLAITMYEPPIPLELRGQVRTMTLPYHKHDCEALSIYADEFQEDELIMVTEKIHGSLVSLTCRISNNKVGHYEVASKGLGRKGIILENTEQNKNNFYFKAIHNSALVEIVELVYGDIGDGIVQVIGEAVPIQTGFDYGATKPEVFIYKIVVDGQVQPYATVSQVLKDLWVPILYTGKYDAKLIKAYANKPLSTLSDHIREGVVVTPLVPRTSSEGFDLALKFISDAYAKKSTGEEFN